MKGAIFSILLLFTLFPERAFAQNGLELMIFRGWYPIVYSSDLLPDLRSETLAGELIRPFETGEPVRGMNGVDIHYEITDQLSVGLHGAYLQMDYEVRLASYRRPYNTLAQLSVQERSFILSPSARFNWFPGKSTVYSGVQLGFWLFQRTSDRDDIMAPIERIMATGQATLIGLRIGGALAGHVEWGYGHKGIFLFGLSYSFFSKAHAD